MSGLLKKGVDGDNSIVNKPGRVDRKCLMRQVPMKKFNYVSCRLHLGVVGRVLGFLQQEGLGLNQDES
jgi:hypothetical protein